MYEDMDFDELTAEWVLLLEEHAQISNYIIKKRTRANKTRSGECAEQWKEQIDDLEANDLKSINAAIKECSDAMRDVSEPREAP